MKGLPKQSSIILKEKTVIFEEIFMFKNFYNLEKANQKYAKITF
tara:strand:- start:435 stop:566 length:132 start_codon:yes stop_codon:yes gene_type:complete